MSGKQLTADQLERINKLKEESIKKIDQIPETPCTGLDYGRSEPYYSIWEELMANIKAIMDE